MTRLPQTPSAAPKTGGFGDYVLTALVVLGLCAALAYGLWRAVAHPANPASQAARLPVGFGPGWHCESAGPKGGGFCLRTSPPDAARNHAPRGS